MINFDRNVKQLAFATEVIKAAKGLSPNRFFAFGGAIRGGKTFCVLGILAILAAKLFPGSRWHIFRRNMAVLIETTIPSMMKILPDQPGRSWRYVRSRGDFHIEFSNGSKIFFTGENIDRDRELEDLLGLETNGIFMEQAEELSIRLLRRAKERSGSWYIDPMPPPLIFMTFNPTDEWPKDEIYDPYKDGKLSSPWCFVEALPDDNPFVTPDQWALWNEMDEVDYNRFIKGDWDSKRTGGEFYHAFSRTRHCASVKYDPNMPIHVTFDQNTVPYITSCLWQVKYLPDGKLRLSQFDEVCLSNPRNTTEALCEEIMARYGEGFNSVMYLYGDASGNKNDTRSKDTDYDIARRVLRRVTSADSDRTMRSNPNVVKRRGFINKLFQGKYNIDIVIDPDTCRNTVTDYTKLKQDRNGNKHKELSTDENGITFEKYGHTSDANDYFIVQVLESLWFEYLNQ